MKRRHTLLDVPGITSFITTTIVNFEPVFANYDLMAVAINTLAESAGGIGANHGFVIMPNHMHLLEQGKQRLFQDSLDSQGYSQRRN
jgi:REP element-mobilizing transposase RayT